MPRLRYFGGCNVTSVTFTTCRVCLVFHVLFLIIFVAQLVPWTLVAVQLLFSTSGVLVLSSKHIISLLALLSKSALYLVEGVFRSVVR